MSKKKEAEQKSFNQKANIDKWSRLSQQELLSDFDLQQFGLNNTQVANISAKHHKNEIATVKFRWGRQLIESLFNPFNILLFLIVIYEFIMYFAFPSKDGDANTLELASGIIVLVMIFLSGIVDYIQQIKTFTTNQGLKKLISNKSKVIRNLGDIYHNLENRDSLSIVKKATNVESSDLIPGDLLYLTIGDVIPCDARVLVGKNFKVNQSSLTGESVEILKTPRPVDAKQNDFINYDNICYMGTSVTSGAAVCMVLNTGEDTYLATIANNLGEKKQTSQFNKGINWITKVLLISIMVIIPIILIIGGLRTNQWIDAIVFAVSVAVGLTPESLPMIIVANLTRGVKKLAKGKIIIKNNDAIQTLGAIDVLCTDKTGTLTEDKLSLNNYYGLSHHNEPFVLKLGYINSYYQAGYHNLLDEAIIQYKSQVHFLDGIDVRYEKLDEISFDFTRRCMSVIVKDKQTNESRLVIKGAFNEVFANSKFYLDNGEVKELDEANKSIIKAFVDELDSKGARAIAVAYRDVEEKEEYQIEDERNLVFCGFLTFADVPKQNVDQTLKLINKYKIAVKILTGDNLNATLSVCKEIGLKVEGVLTGEQMEKMTDDEVAKKVEICNVFAKLNPHQKALLIMTLQKNKHIVGFMGDGINDSIALHKADVGISVDNASSIAKESANIIMLEKSLLFLERGIIEGRSIFVNIIKYIKITVAANFGFMLSLIIGTAWLSFSPMAPIQLLFQNLLYDFSQLAVVFDRVDEVYIAKPQSWNTKNIIPFALFNGPILTLSSVINFLIVGFGFGVLNHADSLASQQIFNTSYFTEAALIHMLMIFIYRTDSIPIFKSRPTYGLTLPIIAFCALILALPYIPGINDWLVLAALPSWWYLWMFCIAVGFILISELMKRFYKWKFKFWLL